MVSFRLNIEALIDAQDARVRSALYKRWKHNDNNLSCTNADD
jgi:hypothetical protein